MNFDVRDVNELASAVKAAFDQAGATLEGIKQRNLELQAEVLELKQRSGRGGGGGASMGNGLADDGTELADLLLKSDALGIFNKGQSNVVTLEVPQRLLQRKAITNVALGVDNPLTTPDRARDIVAAPRRRLTIRGLFQSIPTTSDIIETPTESSFTNNAAVQNADASPTGSGEGALKAQSYAGFSLSRTQVKTIAHFIIASRQVMSDSARLQRYLNMALLAGLAEKEEDEFLTGDGTSNSMTGIVSSASAFTDASTNQTLLDAMARAANQLDVNNYTPSGFVMHPTDWLSARLAKDSQGRYILGDPAAETMPAAWGLPVVPTPAMTLGQFVCLDAAKFGYIADREAASIRISENVDDQFVRNLVTLLAEERSAIIVENANAAVLANVSYAG